MIRLWTILQTGAGLRRWLLQVLFLILAFILLALLIWLYYDYRIKRIEQLSPSALSDVH